jgi:hypothetical protein
MAQPADSVPLVVDLDGTLLRSDALLESFFSAIRAHPLLLLSAPFWLLKGVMGQAMSAAYVAPEAKKPQPVPEKVGAPVVPTPTRPVRFSHARAY